MKKLALLAMSSVFAVSAIAQTQNAKFNEVFFNPPGTDDNKEFVELIGAGSLTGLTLLSIDGDGASAGVIDQAISLNSLSFGTNGLLLLRDAQTNIAWVDEFQAAQAGPSAGTNVTVGDFAPDLENGSNTFVIVSGFTGAVGNDLDTDNNGTVDTATPWSSVLDAIGVTENDGAANFEYATGFGFFGFAALAFTPDAVFRIRDGQGNNWVGMDVNGVVGGNYPADLLEVAFQANYNPAVDLAATFAGGQGATPGGINEILKQEPVPEPASLAALGLGAMALIRKRRNRK
ncbi:MAG: PEP-CTERM sorting domain-containing protein [Chlorobia bacterium]|nr:PEP-CTERM sorting domain-containing protein [Fimbriimonadaceae bacterium]